jgi:hypothetical protein
MPCKSAPNGVDFILCKVAEQWHSRPRLCLRAGSRPLYPGLDWRIGPIDSRDAACCVFGSEPTLVGKCPQQWPDGGNAACCVSTQRFTRHEKNHSRGRLCHIPGWESVPLQERHFVAARAKGMGTGLGRLGTISPAISGVALSDDGVSHSRRSFGTAG